MRTLALGALLVLGCAGEEPPGPSEWTGDYSFALTCTEGDCPQFRHWGDGTNMSLFWYPGSDADAGLPLAAHHSLTLCADSSTGSSRRATTATMNGDRLTATFTLPELDGNGDATGREISAEFTVDLGAAISGTVDLEVEGARSKMTLTGARLSGDVCQGALEMLAQ